MKKLLLALVVLAGLSLPVMAKNCEQYYHNLLEDRYDSTDILSHLVRVNDLECVKYYVNVVGLNVNDDSLRTNGLSPIGYSFHPSQENPEYNRTTDPEIVSFLLEKGLKVKSKDILVATLAFILDAEYDAENFYNTSNFENFKLVVNKNKEDIWSLISEDSIYNIIYEISMERLKNTSFIEFLLDSGLPQNEYGRYIDKTKYIIFSKYEDAPYVNSYEEILEQNRKYEVAKQILTLFEQAKAANVQKTNDEVTKTVNDSLQSSPKSELHIDIINWDYK